jgi:parallel beta-helix repeat protein
LTRRSTTRLRTRWLAALTFVLLAGLVTTCAQSNASQSVVPTAPSSVSAVPGNRAATVRWTKPSTDNGSPITSYIVTPYLGSTAQTPITVGLVLSKVVSGLTNAKSYTFRVAARNAHGTGPTRSSLAITIGAPHAPGSPSATVSGTNVTVHWTAPASTPGYPVTGYTVVPYLNGSAHAPHAFASTSLSQTIFDLLVGESYTFRVAARNAFGLGPYSSPTAAVKPVCVGKAMTHGQSDINGAPGKTTFCLSGIHNWTLTPKAGDRLFGPATLDGGNATHYAVVAEAPDVILESLKIQHYNNGNGTQDGAIHIDDNGSTKATASNWLLRNLDVGFNSASGSGSGDGWTFTAGRFHDNHQEGIGGAMGDNVTINGVEIDHNDFTDSTYKTRNWSCGDEAGGVKWVSQNMTVENSVVHDNACKGLWADLNGNYAFITHNQIYNNWDEGVFIEISSRATITYNSVRNNGWHVSGSGCSWLWGGGITLASSDHVNVSGNNVSGNCNGITGTQQDRPDGNPGLLENLDVHNNVIAGSQGVTGVGEDNGADLSTRNIVFVNNSFGSGAKLCALSC